MLDGISGAGMGGALSGFGGGATGGPLGQAGLDLAPYKMPVIGGFFQDPNEIHQQQQHHNMALAYGAMRPETAQSWGNAMMQAQTIAQPYNDALLEMYGPSAQTNMAFANQNPMSPRSMGIGSPNDVAAGNISGAGELGDFGRILGMIGVGQGGQAGGGGSSPTGGYGRGYTTGTPDYAEALRGSIDEVRGENERKKTKRGK